MLFAFQIDVQNEIQDLALEALWQRYQTETLQKEMQEFLVTEEIKQLAGGEVTLTVHIDEEEYRNAICDFIRLGTEGI